MTAYYRHFWGIVCSWISRFSSQIPNKTSICPSLPSILARVWSFWHGIIRTWRGGERSGGQQVRRSEAGPTGKQHRNNSVTTFPCWHSIVRSPATRIYRVSRNRRSTNNKAWLRNVIIAQLRRVIKKAPSRNSYLKDLLLARLHLGQSSGTRKNTSDILIDFLWTTL